MYYLSLSHRTVNGDFACATCVAPTVYKSGFYAQFKINSGLKKYHRMKGYSTLQHKYYLWYIPIKVEKSHSDTEKCTLTDEKEMKKIMAIDAK